MNNNFDLISIIIKLFAIVVIFMIIGIVVLSFLIKNQPDPLKTCLDANGTYVDIPGKRGCIYGD